MGRFIKPPHPELICLFSVHFFAYKAHARVHRSFDFILILLRNFDSFVSAPTLVNFFFLETSAARIFSFTTILRFIGFVFGIMDVLLLRDVLFLLLRNLRLMFLNFLLPLLLSFLLLWNFFFLLLRKGLLRRRATNPAITTAYPPFIQLKINPLTLSWLRQISVSSIRTIFLFNGFDKRISGLHGSGKRILGSQSSSTFSRFESSIPTKLDLAYLMIGTPAVTSCFKRITGVFSPVFTKSIFCECNSLIKPLSPS